MTLKNLQVDEFEIHVADEGGVLRLYFRGAIHAIAPEEFLSPYLEKALEVAQSNGAQMICDFTRLDYMNSASIPPLIQLLRSLAELRIKGEYVYDAKRKVQTASFRALDVIARKSEFTRVTGV